MMTSTEPHFATRLNSFALGGGVAHPATKTPTLDLIEVAGTVKGLTALEVNYPEHFVDHTPTELSSAIKDAGLVNTGIQVRWPASRPPDFRSPQGETLDHPRVTRDRWSTEGLSVCDSSWTQMSRTDAD